MKPDIRNWKEIDSAWLEGVLQQNQIDAKIADFTAKPVGTGQIGDCARFKINYAQAPDNAPTSLVGKFPAEGEESRNTGKALFNYYREVKFYQNLQAKAKISTPVCYHADLNEDTHEFVLMMEDLAPAEQGDQLQGCTLDEARLVVSEAAKLHASFWNDDSLDEHFWIQETSNAPEVVSPEMFAGTWQAFKDRYGDRVTDRAKYIGDHLSANMDKYGERREGNKCLIHTDYRPDNMLFATAEGGKPITVVDWQSFAYGPPASDVGYFIAGALEPSLRKANEKELLDLYAKELTKYGAGTYSDEELTRHYVLGGYQHFMTAYFAAVVVTQTERGDNMFFKMLNGGVDLIFDHGAEDWFS